jgi:hypothetical protein
LQLPGRSPAKLRSQLQCDLSVQNWNNPWRSLSVLGFNKEFGDLNRFSALRRKL